MKLNPKDIEQLRSILAACKVVGIEGVVLHEGRAMGAKPSLDAAIISNTDMTSLGEARLGIGRVGELDKRLNVFGANVEIELKHNDSGDVSMMTLSSGKTKMQFRCTSASLMRYPKSNQDTDTVKVTLTRAEVQQISKAVKTLGADRLSLQITRTGTAKMECVDSSNDRFDIELGMVAEFLDEPASSVNAYIANVLMDVLDAAAKDAEEITLTLGEAGSITVNAKGHRLFVFSQLNDGDEDDE